MAENEHIEMNLLKDRAIKADEITDEMFEQCNKDNQDMMNEYLEVNAQLSKETRKQYTCCLRQFFYFVYEHLGNKPYYKITKRDFSRYYSNMIERGLSSSAISLRKAACSSFCNYIESMVADEVEEAKNFRNFTRNMPQLAKNRVYEKVAITKDEYDFIIDTLSKKEDWLGVAWVATAFNVGARRAEIIQFKKEILDYPIENGKSYVMSHIVRGKGKSIDGKPIRYMIPLNVLGYWKKWIDVRGYDSEYIFTTRGGQQMSKSWADTFCKNVITPMLGRRINVHIFKNSAITYMLEKGVDIKIVSKYFAQHESVETTGIYDLRSFDEEKDKIFE